MEQCRVQLPARCPAGGEAAPFSSAADPRARGIPAPGAAPAPRSLPWTKPGSLQAVPLVYHESPDTMERWKKKTFLKDCYEMETVK